MLARQVCVIVSPPPHPGSRRTLANHVRDGPAEEKDLVIIGGGVAGYVAAIKAGQEGLKVRRQTYNSSPAVSVPPPCRLSHPTNAGHTASL